MIIFHELSVWAAADGKGLNWPRTEHVARSGIFSAALGSLGNDQRCDNIDAEWTCLPGIRALAAWPLLLWMCSLERRIFNDSNRG
jgi:hypothetical protein